MNKSLIATLLFVAAPLLAQPAETDTFRVFRSEVELQAYRFGNFFQARDGQPEQSVNAFGAEYRAAYRARLESPDYYAGINVLHYSGTDTEMAYGARIGSSFYGSVHSYNVYLDRQENGYAFDVGDQTATANITTVGGNYTYRLTRNWQVGLDTYLDWQRFDVATGFENEYRSLGAQVRYRGFGPAFQPRIGYVSGEREVRSASDSYDDRYWYVQVNSQPNPRFNGSVRYRSRSRDYQNVAREDDRGQWTLRGTYRQNDRLAWTASYGNEDVQSSLPGRDFQTDGLFAGLIIGF